MLMSRGEAGVIVLAGFALSPAGASVPGSDSHGCPAVFVRAGGRAEVGSCPKRTFPQHPRGTDAKTLLGVKRFGKGSIAQGSRVPQHFPKVLVGCPRPPPRPVLPLHRGRVFLLHLNLRIKTISWRHVSPCKEPNAATAVKSFVNSYMFNGRKQ